MLEDDIETSDLHGPDTDILQGTEIFTCSRPQRQLRIYELVKSLHGLAFFFRALLILILAFISHVLSLSL